jgi:hypothetical protein
VPCILSRKRRRPPGRDSERRRSGEATLDQVDLVNGQRGHSNSGENIDDLMAADGIADSAMPVFRIKNGQRR